MSRSLYLSFSMSRGEECKYVHKVLILVCQVGVNPSYAIKKGFGKLMVLHKGQGFVGRSE